MKKGEATAKPPVFGWFALTPRFREGVFIVFVAIFIFAVLSLTSYDLRDPGWSRTGSGVGVYNAMGPVGAWLADVAFSLFGYMAYLFPVMLAYRCWVLFKERYSPQPFDWVIVSMRFSGLALVMLGSTALAVLSDVNANTLPLGAGGILGQSVANATINSFSLTGARLVLVAVFFFGMTIFTDLSWLALMDKLGALTIRGVTAVWIWVVSAWNQLKQRKQITDQKKQRKAVIDEQVNKDKKRTPPKIKPPKPEANKPSVRAEKERQRTLFKDMPVKGSLPPLELLEEADKHAAKGYSAEALEQMSKLLEIKLADFGVVAEVVAVYPGPVVTRFEIQPAAGVKVSKISNLVKDLARSLAVISVRVVEVIPGKPFVGIEIPNQEREIVNFREVLSSEAFDNAKSALTLALGHDISGDPVCADLAKMPHLLVAGTTGSGKSVGVNAMILSLLYKSTPEDVRLMMVDPKMLELSIYEGIPHLLTPVITDMKDAANGLRWCVGEMERRYKLMAELGVRNLAGFNRKVEEAAKLGEPIADPLWNPEEHFSAGEEQPQPPSLEVLPAIVVVIDEFADMMMIVGKKVEELIARIAQKARAAGIHLILATQRPSVDVITGLIKANVPTRIAFQVSSKIDSRTILDQGGAEQLLGHGDMLYLPPGSGIPIRVHGAFVSDEDVHNVVADWRKRGAPDYIDNLLEESSNTAIPGMGEDNQASDEGDELYDQAVKIVTESRRASISSVQRKLRIGYNRAARLVETMEAAGVVTEAGHNGIREVLAPPPVN